MFGGLGFVQSMCAVTLSNIQKVPAIRRQKTRIHAILILIHY